MSAVTRLSRIIAAISASAICISVGAASPSISVSVSGPAYQQSGTSIPIVVTLTNGSSQELYVPQADFSGTHAELDYLVKVMDYKGAILGYTHYGQYANTSVSAGSERIVKLAAGQTVEEESDITQVVSFPGPGLYVVSVVGPADFSQGAVQSNTLRIIVTSGSAPPIPGDLNGDGLVNCADLAIIKAAFGKKVGQVGFDYRADLNGDGVVSILDLSAEARLIPAGTTCAP